LRKEAMNWSIVTEGNQMALTASQTSDEGGHYLGGSVERQKQQRSSTVNR
jgi:hypothetical protein